MAYYTELGFIDSVDFQTGDEAWCFKCRMVRRMCYVPRNNTAACLDGHEQHLLNLVVNGSHRPTAGRKTADPLPADWEPAEPEPVIRGYWEDEPEVA